jgi:flavin-dependent dehydrogenase
MHDTMIVGARCAGSALGRLLARRGYRVLRVDCDACPRDMPMSSPFVPHRGATCLARWGLCDQVVATNRPPVSRFDEELVAAERSRWPV